MRSCVPILSLAHHIVKNNIFLLFIDERCLVTLNDRKSIKCVAWWPVCVTWLCVFVCKDKLLARCIPNIITMLFHLLFHASGWSRRIVGVGRRVLLVMYVDWTDRKKLDDRRDVMFWWVIYDAFWTCKIFFHPIIWWDYDGDVDEILFRLSCSSSRRRLVLFRLVLSSLVYKNNLDWFSGNYEYFVVSSLAWRCNDVSMTLWWCICVIPVLPGCDEGQNELS